MATAAARRTQAERRDASEQRLLTAAALLIARDGFAAATFDRIGEMAGYSRSLASQKFGSKDGVVHAVIAFVSDRLERLMAQRLAAAPSPVEELIAYMDSFLTQVEADELVRAYFVMMAAAIANRLPIQSAFLERHDAVKGRLAEIVRRGQADGSIGPAIDADAAALSIGSYQLGVSVELLLDPDLDVTRLRATILPTLRRALTP